MLLLEFELASIALALEVTGALPAERFLTLNASPATIIERSEEIAALLAGIGRQIVIEVTEHVRIDDYDELRAAVRRIGDPPHFTLCLEAVHQQSFLAAPAAHLLAAPQLQILAEP